MSTRPSNAATPAANAASKSSTPLNNQTPLNATPQPAPPSKVVTNSALSVSFAPSVVDGVGQPAASTITAASSTPAPFGSVAPALNALDYYLKKAPDAHYVSLQGFDLVDVAPVLPGLSRLRGMRHLNLAHNALWRLPDDLSMLSSLERLDLTKNRFATASLMLKGLFSLRNLKHLHVHLPEAEEEILVASLASLKTLNGIPLDDADAPDLATMASKVVAAPASSVLNTSSPAAGLDAMQASAHASGTATPMPDMPAARLPSAKELDDEHRQALLQEHRGYDTTTGVAGRYNLLPWTFETSQQYKTLQLLCAKVSGNASNTAEFEEFHAMVVSHLKARIRSEAGDVLRHQVHQFHASSLLLEYCNEEVSRASGKYGAELSTALKALAAAHLQTMQQASAIMMAMQDDRDRKIAALQKDLAAALMVHEHTRVNVAQSDGFEADFLKSMEDERKMADRKGFVMDRRELNTVIEGIVSSKIKHDEANSLAKIPNETMEQHVYTYFTERLGSTEAIRSAVASVLNSLAAHEKFDIDVAVFAKIIHLELDEEYWTLHKLLSTVIYDSVHNVLAGRGRERAAVDVFTGRLNSYQIEEVVNAIFPQEDNGWRNRGIVAYARTLAEERGEELSSLTSTTIGYRDFAFILLRQTLERRLKDIEPLTVRFRELDREHNGVIDAVQMRMLIHDLAPGLSTQKEREILHAVDPFGNNIITFSDAVSLLVAHQDYWWMTERGRASNDKSNPRRRKVDVHELWEENRETASRSPPRTARSPAREAASALGRRRR